MALAVKQAPFFISPCMHQHTKNNRNPTVKCYDRVAVAFCL